jgi:hypothetical protein
VAVAVQQKAQQQQQKPARLARGSTPTCTAAGSASTVAAAAAAVAARREGVAWHMPLSRHRAAIGQAQEHLRVCNPGVTPSHSRPHTSAVCGPHMYLMRTFPGANKGPGSPLGFDPGLTETGPRGTWATGHTR